MSNDPRYIHHVIILSDGESDPVPALAQAGALAARGITVSAITIGPYSPLMAEIARTARGRYHVTNNPGSLPALMVREAQFRQPPAHRQGRFVPTVETAHRALENVDFGAAPPLLGHALASTRPGADTLLASAEHPILAHWHFGLGQVASFTSSTTSGWANEWRAWSGFRTFWSELAWSMMRSRTVDPLELRVDHIPGEANRARVTAIAPTLRLAPVPELEVVRDAREGGEALALAAIGPGVFTADVDVDDGFLVTARMPGEPEPTAARAIDRSYAPELGRFGVDDHALERLAEIGGGSILEAPRAIVARVDPELVPRSLRQPAFIAALFLYLLSVLLLRLPDRAAANARDRGDPRAELEAPGAARHGHGQDPTQDEGGGMMLPHPARPARLVCLARVTLVSSLLLAALTSCGDEEPRYGTVMLGLDAPRAELSGSTRGATPRSSSRPGAPGSSTRTGPITCSSCAT
jgi:hypothetical protein